MPDEDDRCGTKRDSDATTTRLQSVDGTLSVSETYLVSGSGPLPGEGPFERQYLSEREAYFLPPESKRYGMRRVRTMAGVGVAATTALAAVLVFVESVLGVTGAYAFAALVLPLSGEAAVRLPRAAVTVLRLLWFGVLYVVAWPTVYPAFARLLPGDSRLFHGALFGLVVWSVSVVVRLAVAPESAVLDRLSVVVSTLVAYVVYGGALALSEEYLRRSDASAGSTDA
ncbi:DUF6789 family protein [Haloarcula marina]|uniref:DUF6789 family protein n=2 Tax=Haloarcula marina TaxID=2961574 RepID=UPI0020B798D6|nr:DUF6789 family protein [Halomicroarcula marina]